MFVSLQCLIWPVGMRARVFRYGEDTRLSQAVRLPLANQSHPHTPKPAQPLSTARCLIWPVGMRARVFRYGEDTRLSQAVRLPLANQSHPHTPKPAQPLSTARCKADWVPCRWVSTPVMPRHQPALPTHTTWILLPLYHLRQCLLFTVRLPRAPSIFLLRWA